MYRISSKSHRLQNVATYFRQLATNAALKNLPHGKGPAIYRAGLDTGEIEMGFAMECN